MEKVPRRNLPVTANRDVQDVLLQVPKDPTNALVPAAGGGAEEEIHSRLRRPLREQVPLVDVVSRLLAILTRTHTQQKCKKVVSE